MAGLYMSERFGAWQVGDDPDKGAVQFKLFFPDRTKDPSQYEARVGQPTYGNPQITQIRVAGDFMHALGLTDWDWANGPVMTKAGHAKGVVWSYVTPVELPQGFYQYKYFVTFANGTTRKAPDPCTRYGGPADQNSGVVIGGLFSKLIALRLAHPALRSDNFYPDWQAWQTQPDPQATESTWPKASLFIIAGAARPWVRRRNFS